MTATELSSRIGAEMGLGSWFAPWTGTPAEFERLSLGNRIELTNRMRAYVREHPSEFPAAVVAVARSGSGTISAPDSYTAADALGDFFGEMGAQAADINAKVNPFSAENRGLVLGAVALGLLLYFVGPRLIEAAAATKGKAAK